MGLDVGPTFIWEDGKFSAGLGITPYTGIVAIPFLTLTIRYPGSLLFEAGGSLKAPISVYNEGFDENPSFVE